MTKFNEFYEKRMGVMLEEEMPEFMKNPLHPSGGERRANHAKKGKAMTKKDEAEQKNILRQRYRDHGDEVAAGRNWGQNFYHGTKDFLNQQKDNLGIVGKKAINAVSDPVGTGKGILNTLKKTPEYIDAAIPAGAKWASDKVADVLKTGGEASANLVHGTLDTAIGAATGDKERMEDGWNKAVVNPYKATAHEVQNKANRISNRAKGVEQNAKNFVKNVATGRLLSGDTFNLNKNAMEPNDAFSDGERMLKDVEGITREVNPTSHEGIQTSMNALKNSNALAGAQKAAAARKKNRVAQGPVGNTSRPPT